MDCGCSTPFSSSSYSGNTKEKSKEKERFVSNMCSKYLISLYVNHVLLSLPVVEVEPFPIFRTLSTVCYAS
jgi:hypothetical protein